ncbi:MAG: hypothetical protein ABIH70_09190 [Chloroflexota bacterium]
MVLAGTLLNFVAGGTLVYGFTVFFNPIRETFGWTAAVYLYHVFSQGRRAGDYESAGRYLD